MEISKIAKGTTVTVRVPLAMQKSTKGLSAKMTGVVQKIAIDGRLARVSVKIGSKTLAFRPQDIVKKN